MGKRQKVQIAALLVLLAAVVAAGVWYFTRDDQPRSSGTDAAPSQLEALDPSAQRYSFQLTDESQERFWDGSRYLWELFFYDGHLLRAAAEGDAWLALEDVATGETVLTYDVDDMGFASEQDGFVGCYLDRDGQLWSLILDADGTYRVVLAGQQPQTLGSLDDYPFQYAPSQFAVWEEKVVLTGTTPSGSKSMVIYDLSDGTQTSIGGVSGFCLDGQGGLYYSLSNEGLLCKRSLTTLQDEWQRKTVAEEGISVQGMFYHPDLGLATLSSATGQVDIRDAERGEVSYTLFSVAEDTDLTFTEDRFYSAAFAVDSAFHVYLSCVELDGDTPPFTYTRTTWCYAPYLPEVAQTVTLTITAPYQVEAVASSVRMYQRSHPEVEVVWDVAYASREEFQKHSAQYAEQLALRLMTGDVGDILMLHGTGLDVDAVLQTDALADLSDDLAACSFRDDLEDSVLDSLREESGAIRALPVAISPQYLVYNETLAQQLGLTWDEEDLTWSELLDLAQQWQADDSPYSLFWSDRDYDNVDLLYGLLLANLDSFAQADGSVDLSWLGGQLEQLKALQGSQQLKSDFDGFWWDAGSFDHTLLMELSGADYTELLVDLKLAEENNGVTLKLVSMPRGDQTEARQSYAFCWGISAVSAQKDAAWSFLEFLISQDGLVSDTYFTETCLLNQAADRERFEQTVKMTADYVDGVMQIENEERHYEQFRALLAHPISRLAEPTRWKSAIYTPLSQYMDGTLELSQALAQASDAWQRVLAE